MSFVFIDWQYSMVPPFIVCSDGRSWLGLSLRLWDKHYAYLFVELPPFMNILTAPCIEGELLLVVSWWFRQHGGTRRINWACPVHKTGIVIILGCRRGIIIHRHHSIPIDTIQLSVVIDLVDEQPTKQKQLQQEQSSRGHSTPLFKNQITSAIFIACNISCVRSSPQQGENSPPATNFGPRLFLWW